MGRKRERGKKKMLYHTVLLKKWKLIVQMLFFLIMLSLFELIVHSVLILEFAL